jgi:hypothetical protein
MPSFFLEKGNTSSYVKYTKYKKSISPYFISHFCFVLLCLALIILRLRSVTPFLADPGLEWFRRYRKY